jgi:hypothetical protein
MIKKLPAFYKTQRFITLYTTRHQFFPIQRQIIPVHNLSFYFSTTNFQLILPPTTRNLSQLITKTLYHELINKMPLKLTLTTVCMLEEIKTAPSPSHWSKYFQSLCITSRCIIIGVISTKFNCV